VLMGAISLILIFVIYGTGQEIASFADPAYQNDLILRLSRAVKNDSSAQSRIFWIGVPTTISPGETIFIDEEGSRKESYYLYHASANAISYYSDRAAFNLYPYSTNFTLQSFQGMLQNSDQIVINTGDPLQPLQRHRFTQLQVFTVDSESNNSKIFTEPGNRARIVLSVTENGLQLTGPRVPLLLWEIRLRTNENIFLNCLPVLQLPLILTVDAKLSEINEINAVVLDNPPELFY
jgi:hypothetical protein